MHDVCHFQKCENVENIFQIPHMALNNLKTSKATFPISLQEMLSRLCGPRYTVDGKKSSTPAFLAITRYHSIEEVPGYVVMVPTSLLELPKPSIPPGESQKPGI